jgi:Dolichyl-phosphate-mannose-protein mannosyltransferase
VKLLHGLALGLVAIGVIGRLVRYFLQFPIWGDEAFLCFNLIDRDFAGLTHLLEYGQVAPILFLWAEVVVTRLLGISELAMRLLPFLASLAALGLFWRLAWSTVSPLAALIAIGLLAVARWPVTMGAFVKPYIFDLLLALVLLVPAVEWLRRPQQPGWLVALAVGAPVALLGSYPAVFIAGGVSLALLPTAWRSNWAGRSLFIAYNLLVAASFLVSYGIVGREQPSPWLLEYWAEAFPPWQLWPLVKWLVLFHTGQLMAFPVGDANGGSTVTALLFAVGVWTWWKGGRRSLLVLWLTPFALNLLAAAMHLYPYGVARLSQHLAPAVCLLAGTGLAALLERFVPSDALRLRWTFGVSTVLALCAVGGVVMDVVRPYRDLETAWEQQMAGEILGRVEPGDQLVVIQGKYDVDPPFRWYLETRFRDVRWLGRIDWDRLTTQDSHLIVVNFWRNLTKDASVPPTFDEPAAHGWKTVEQIPYSIPSNKGKLMLHAEVRRWTPPPNQGELEPRR